MKKVLIGLAVVAVIAVVAVLLFGGKKEPLKFKTDKVTRGEIVEKVTATGTINAVTTVQVGTQVSGTIKDLSVDFNTPVKKGQLIAQIDPATFDAQVGQSRADLLSTKADLARGEAALLDARRTSDRNKQLFTRNLIARAELDTSETAVATAEAQVAAFRARVAQSEAALRYAEINLRYTRIISPVDGVVISRNVDVGQTVAASFQTPTLFTIAKDLTKMQIDTNVDEADIGKVKVDQDVDFTVDAYPGETFKGAVSQVRNAPIVVQNVVTYDVIVKVDNTDLKLKPGMTANVAIITNKRPDVLKVPNAALRFLPPDTKPSTTKPGVWVKDGDKQKRIELTTGGSDGSFTEVLSGDVTEGLEVIVETLQKKNGKSQAAPQSGPRLF
ncbi:MAG: efflux RND transporter periplasmic adaptor subunit [Nitrospirales bacterium]|nr:efflux RND transporter periplasmic adaptor subunit [Nitrospirales bacterium]